MAIRTAAISCAIAMSALLGPPVLSAPGSMGVPDGARGELGLYTTTISGLHGPSAVAIDEEGTIWITDTEESRIVYFDQEGTQRGSFGHWGGGPGEFRRPQGIAVDESGNVIVSDTGNSRIQVFDRHGLYKRGWGKRGPGEGELANPAGVATGNRLVLVADTGNHRIQIFDAAGSFQSVIGKYGAEPGTFNRPIDVAVDNDGVVWVVDSRNQRLQWFDLSGHFLGVTGTFGPYAGLLSSPLAIDLYKGRAYVADAANDRIQVFESDGAVRYQWGLRAIGPREGEGRLHHPEAIAVAPSGNFAVVCEYTENRCQVFGTHPAGDAADTYDEAIIEVDQLSHFGRYCHASSNVLVINEPAQHSILVFSTAARSPALICRFGGYGRRFGQFVDPAGVFYDARQGRIYVNDCGNRRLQVFQINKESLETVKYDPFLVRFVKGLDYGSLLGTEKGSELKWIPEPQAIAVAGDGTVYTADPLNARVLVFNPHLEFVGSWGGVGEEAGRFRDPSGVAFSGDETRVFVADAGNARVQMFDCGGSYLGTLPAMDGAPDQLRRPFGLAVSSDGETFVSDQVLHQVFHFDKLGSIQSIWGGMGLGPGRFFWPADVSMLTDESLVVLDFGNHRAQILDLNGTMMDVFGARQYVQPARRSGGH